MSDYNRTIRLWLMNDEGTYWACTRAAHSILEESQQAGHPTTWAASDMGDWLQENIGEILLSNLEGMARELMQSVIEEVDWEDLGEEFIADCLE